MVGIPRTLRVWLGSLGVPVRLGSLGVPVRLGSLGVMLLLGCLGVLVGCGGGADVEPAVPQTFLAVSPASGAAAGGTQITLRGTGFLDPFFKITDVRFGAMSAAGWTIVDDETIVAESPPGPSGVTVINLVGDNAPLGDGILLARGFTYRAPRVYVAEGPAALDPKLYAVNPETGVVTPIGSIGFDVESMAMSPQGELYAVEWASPYRLVQIDVHTGAGTALAFVRDAFFDTPVKVSDVSFVDGRMLGRTEENCLVEIDLATGAATNIGVITVATPGGGIATLGDDALYLAELGPSAQLSVLNVISGFVSPGPVLERPVLFTDLIFDGDEIYALEADLPGPEGVGLVRIESSLGAVDVVVPLPAAAVALARDF